MEKQVYVYGAEGGRLITREETAEERLCRENCPSHAKTPTLGERVTELESIAQMILEGIE